MRETVTIFLLVVSATLVAGCVDIRDFEGRWRGSVVTEPAVRDGFTEEARVDPLLLSNVDLQGLTATLTTSDGRFTDTLLTAVNKFSSDTLASMTFDGNPMRSFLLFGTPAGEEGCSALVVISLFADDHVELRIIRDNDLFGIFSLERVEER
jgi:hypothetical protein